MCGKPKCLKKAQAALAAAKASAAKYDPLAPQIAVSKNPVGRPRKIRVLSSNRRRG